MAKNAKMAPPGHATEPEWRNRKDNARWRLGIWSRPVKTGSVDPVYTEEPSLLSGRGCSLGDGKVGSGAPWWMLSRWVADA